MNEIIVCPYCNKKVIKLEWVKNQECLDDKTKFDWSGVCATSDNRNQCSEKNCILFPICKIKKPKLTSKGEKEE